MSEQTKADIAAERDSLKKICDEHEKLNAELVAERDALTARVAELEAAGTHGRVAQVAGVAVVATQKVQIGKRKLVPGDPIGVVLLEDGISLLGMAGAVYAGKAKAGSVGDADDAAE